MKSERDSAAFADLQRKTVQDLEVQCGTLKYSNDQVRFILGLPNYHLVPIVRLLRDSGAMPDIPTHLEEEMATAILWLLSKYVEHGAEWREKMKPEIEAMATAAKLK